MTYAARHATQIAVLTLQHVELVVTGLLIALVIAVPAGIVAARNSKAGAPIFGLAGAIYTIPSLALLAVAVKYLGLGFWPVVLVLAAYAQFILVRAVSTAIRSVPAAQLDAARGLGMSPEQILKRVQLPLGAPVFLGGLRLAAIALIAIATLGGYAGAGGLGNEIFFGLQRQFIDETLAGSVPAALLAILADVLFRAFEKRARERARA